MSSRFLWLLFTLSLVPAIFFIGCHGPTALHQTEESKEAENPSPYDDPKVAVGVQIGRLQRSIEIWEKALADVRAQGQELEASFLTMPIEDLARIAERQDVYFKQLALLDPKDAIDQLKNPLERVRGEYSEESDRMLLMPRIAYGYARSVSRISVSMDPRLAQIGQGLARVPLAARAMIKTVGIAANALSWIGPVSIALDIANHIGNTTTAIGKAISNTALAEVVARRTQDQNPLSIRTTVSGWISVYEEFSKYLNYFFSYQDGRDILKKLTDEDPPLAKWTCTYCSHDIANLENEAEIAAYLEKHHIKIFIRIDELRLRDPRYFPLYASQYTEVGASRRWRHPMVIAATQSYIEELEAQITSSKALIADLETMLSHMTTIERIKAGEDVPPLDETDLPE